MAIRLTPEQFPAYFWSKVEKTDGCWLWRGSRRSNGYGQIQFQRRGLLAHRVAYELAVGPIPEGHFVCHRCDNPPCVRPDHLFAAPPADNSADMKSKRRQGTVEPRNRARGEGHGRAKLNAEQVGAMRKDRAAGLSWRELGKRYGVSHATAKRICEGKSWSHITAD